MAAKKWFGRFAFIPGDWILEKYTFATNGQWIKFLFVFGHWLFDINNKTFT